MTHENDCKLDDPDAPHRVEIVSFNVRIVEITDNIRR